MPGQLTNSRYRLLGALASGGMGSVHLAELLDGTRERRLVAVKVLHPHLAGDDESVAMFLDEARVAARIDHPSVVRVHDLDFVGQEIVIVMEFVEGVSLSTLLRRTQARGALPSAIVSRILDDVLHGLHAAHEVKDEHGAPLRLVHRDITPHNILVGTDGRSRITDFGIATAAGRLAATKTGTVKGKLHYLAPEQVVRKSLDRRVDIFSSGVVLWECLTGRRLFDGGTEAETLAMVLRGSVEPPSASGADVPIELEEACLKALERDPERRFATAEAFAHALEAVDAPMATHAEVGAVVAELAADAIAGQRALRRGPPAEGDAARDGVAANAFVDRAPVRHRGRRVGVAVTAIAAIVAATAGAWQLVVSRSSAPVERTAPATDTTASRVNPAATPSTEPGSTATTSASAAEPGPTATTSASAAMRERHPAVAPTRSRGAPRAGGASGAGGGSGAAARHAAPSSSRPFMPSDL